jgi:hypothetical protein
MREVSFMNSQDDGHLDRDFRTKVVRFIIDGQPERALELLSRYYGVREPDLRVGTVKRHRDVAACYVEKEKRIYVSKSELLTNPLVILHEFYHHLRACHIDKSRQVEKRADLFAMAFVKSFKSAFGASAR